MIVAAIRLESHSFFAGFDRLVPFFNDEIGPVEQVISLGVIRRGTGLGIQLPDDFIDIAARKHLTSICLSKCERACKHQREDGKLFH